MEVKIRIIVENAPAGVLYALQEGSGSIYKTQQSQRSGQVPLVFESDILISGNEESPPDFKGKIVQGPRGSRFIYLDIGRSAGDPGSVWTRRLKIPLSGISWDLVNTVISSDKNILETRVAGTGKDRGPSCGTVKPFSGWHTAIQNPGKS